MVNSLEGFGVFFREANGGRVSVIVNLTIGDDAPMAHLPCLQRVTVAFPVPNARSPSSSLPGENGSYMGVEMDLIAAMNRETGATFVARELALGQMQFYFYTPHGTSVDSTVVKVLQSYPQFRYRLFQIADPEWTIYFDELYPSRVELQLLTSHERQVLAVEPGDSLENPHSICHWIYFPSPEKRELFLERIRTLGFKFHLLERQEPDALERPYCVELARNDRIDHPYLDELVLWLDRQADECGGEYDGFETELTASTSRDLTRTVQ